MAQVGRLGPNVGSHLALLCIRCSEPGELTQWLSHDDSTILSWYYYYCTVLYVCLQVLWSRWNVWGVLVITEFLILGSTWSEWWNMCRCDELYRWWCSWWQQWLCSEWWGSRRCRSNAAVWWQCWCCTVRIVESRHVVTAHSSLLCLP